MDVAPAGYPSQRLAVPADGVDVAQAGHSSQLLATQADGVDARDSAGYSSQGRATPPDGVDAAEQSSYDQGQGDDPIELYDGGGAAAGPPTPDEDDDIECFTPVEDESDHQGYDDEAIELFDEDFDTASGRLTEPQFFDLAEGDSDEELLRALAGPLVESHDDAEADFLFAPPTPDGDEATAMGPPEVERAAAPGATATSSTELGH